MQNDNKGKHEETTVMKIRRAKTRKDTTCLAVAGNSSTSASEFFF